MTPDAFEVWLERLRDWAERRGDLAGVAIVGSYAREDANPDSDVDVVLVADRAASYLEREDWLAEHGAVAGVAREDYGLVQSLRTRYATGDEVEWGITDEAWLALPPDRGTAAVIARGMLIVHDRDGDLAALQRAVFAGALEALAAASEDETGARFRAVLTQLVQVSLLTADATVETEGDELLPLFTDTVGLFGFDPEAPAAELTGEEAIRLVAAGDYDGLVIDPEGRAFELTRDEVLDLFDIDES